MRPVHLSSFPSINVPRVGRRLLGLVYALLVTFATTPSHAQSSPYWQQQQQQQRQQEQQRQQDQQRQQQQAQQRQQMQDQQRQQMQQQQRQQMQDQQRQQMQQQQRQQMQDQQRQQMQQQQQAQQRQQMQQQQQAQQRQQMQQQQRQQMQDQQRQQMQQQQQTQQRQQMQQQQQSQQRQQQQNQQRQQAQQSSQQQAKQQAAQRQQDQRQQMQTFEQRRKQLQQQGKLGSIDGRSGGMARPGAITRVTRPPTPGEIQRGFTGKVTGDGRALVRFQGRILTVPASRVSGLSARLARQNQSRASRWTVEQQTTINNRTQTLIRARGDLASTKRDARIAEAKSKRIAIINYSAIPKRTAATEQNQPTFVNPNQKVLSRDMELHYRKVVSVAANAKEPKVMIGRYKQYLGAAMDGKSERFSMPDFDQRAQAMQKARTDKRLPKYSDDELNRAMYNTYGITDLFAVASTCLTAKTLSTKCSTSPLRR